MAPDLTFPTKFPSRGRYRFTTLHGSSSARPVGVMDRTHVSHPGRGHLTVPVSWPVLAGGPSGSTKDENEALIPAAWADDNDPAAP